MPLKSIPREGPESYTMCFALGAGVEVALGTGEVALGAGVEVALGAGV